jgi:hypothetical protein
MESRMEDSVMLFGEICANIEAMASVCNPLPNGLRPSTFLGTFAQTMMAVFLQQGELCIHAETTNRERPDSSPATLNM